VKIHNWYLITIIALCTTCSPKKEELGTAPIDSLMIEVFVDIHLSNARSELGYGESGLPLDTIITRHGISKIEYDQQIAFYSEHPDTYLAVLNKVNERITEESRLVTGF